LSAAKNVPVRNSSRSRARPGSTRPTRRAQTGDRLDEFAHVQGVADLLEVPLEIVGWDRAAELFPLMNPAGVIGAAYLPILKQLQFDRIAGLPYAAIPIATSVSVQGGYPMIYPRKEAKQYGTKAEIEGEYRAGETVVVIDDLATTGGSKFEAIEKLTGAGLKVKDVVVLVDRQSGAKEALAEAGFAMHAVLTITEMLDHWEQSGKVEQDKIRETREFLQQRG
jgi:orotate phosphoribosyltransferase